MQRPDSQKQSPSLNNADEFTVPVIPVERGNELRCPECKKLLSKGDLGEGGSIEIKCARCKTLCRFMQL